MDLGCCMLSVDVYNLMNFSLCIYITYNYKTIYFVPPRSLKEGGHIARGFILAILADSICLFSSICQ